MARVKQSKETYLYYTLDEVLEIAKDCQYIFIISNRSDGKTYAVCREGIKKYMETGEQMAYVRKYDVQLRGQLGQQVFASLVVNGKGENEIEKLTDGLWTDTYYYRRCWYLCRYEVDDKGERKRICDEKPFAYAFAVSQTDNTKSTSFPNITTIFWDECISREDNDAGVDWFVLFENLCSTIIRDRDNVRIYMACNNVNKYSPIFRNMGISRIREMEAGDIDIYSYGDSKLKVCVQFANPAEAKKKSSHYYAFDNPKLQMISSSNGAVWEIAPYPLLPKRYVPKDVVYTYYIIYEGSQYQCDIVKFDKSYLTYIFPKTKEIKDPEKSLIFTTDWHYERNYRNSILKPKDKTVQKIKWFFDTDRVCYATYDIGDAIRGFLEKDAGNKVIKS